MAFALDVASLAWINISAQTIGYAFLALGFTFARRREFDWHKKYMKIAAALNYASLFMIMLPAFYSFFSQASVSGTLVPSSILLAHALVGTSALAMATLVIFKSCEWVGKKVALRGYMITMFSLWTAAYAIGIAVFLVFHTSIVPI
jgi:uncharacterized membrane protein YozB (DUF420 family)